MMTNLFVKYQIIDSIINFYLIKSHKITASKYSITKIIELLFIIYVINFQYFYILLNLYKI